MSFKIVTDSTSDLSKGWVEEHGVDVLGLTINLDGQTYETVGDNRLTSATLLEKMESGSQPMTSQVNVGQFEEVFELTNKVQIEFRNSVENLYSKKDKEKGLLIAKDRFNIERSFNLLSVSSAIIEINPNSNISNFDSTLNVLKKASKGSTKPISSIL